MGLTSLQQFVRTLTEFPGVYRMLDAKGEVLYVGKARNLRKRVSSYLRKSEYLAPKTKALMSHVTHIDVTVTPSENEALLLENTLIKKYLPKYNVLLRDDKSYPYIYLSGHPQFPRLELRRGRKIPTGQYFGPYLNVSAARESLNLLHKVFRLRQCNDTFFSNRTRPCLQYQLKRCTAPCVAYINAEDYQHDVEHTKLFLQGKNQQVIDDLVRKMEEASINLNFETAAQLRDQISSLRHVQTQQYVTDGESDCDVLAIECQLGQACVQLLLVRGGQLLGNRPFWLTIPYEESPAEILQTVIEQHYLTTENIANIPPILIVSHMPPEKEWLVNALIAAAGHPVRIIQQARAEQAQLLALAVENAKQALSSHLASTLHWQQQWKDLQEWLKLPSALKRAECFDASHTMGEATVVSCVVFDDKGAVKRLYRRFNIDMQDIAPGDDYAALTQALQRRYKRLLENNTPFPELVIIDGGKGQLHSAEKVFEQLGHAPTVLMSIAKGVSRKPGLEELWFSGKDLPVHLAPDSPILHALQHIRDEAHRSAITGHRKQRAKKRITSVLETIPGIGKKRRQKLLQAFGGIVELKRTSVEEIAKVSGISLDLARQIYNALR
ncbi:MAG: excinuclease ABC subunit UvrC [Gammaproteobacteria bacterium]